MDPVIRTYLSSLDKARRGTITALRDALIETEPSFNESINGWGYLTLTGMRISLTIVTHPNHANLQISNGADIVDVLPQVEGTGRRLRHVKFSYAEDVDRELVRHIVHAATEAAASNSKF